MRNNTSSAQVSTLIFLCSLALMTACSQDDRVVEVTCDGAVSDPISITTEWTTHERRVSNIGYLNSWGLSLGSVVRLKEGSIKTNDIFEWKKLTPTDDHPPLSRTSVGVTTYRYGFQVHMDEDISTAAHRAGVDLNDSILKHTIYEITNPVFRSSHDISTLINQNEEIKEGIRADRKSHFAVVSATITGDSAVLFDTDGLVAVNTREIGNSYIHVSYSCQKIERLRRQFVETGKALPIIIYLTPVKYDDVTSRLLVASHPEEIFQLKWQ